MPSPIAHSMIAVSIYSLLNRHISFKDLFLRNNRIKILFICLLSICPDIDFVMVLITGNELIHGGFTHSITFAIIVCFLLRIIKFNILTSNLCFLIVLSHTLLDMCTINGYYPGTKELFWPFTSTRYSFNEYLGLFNSLDWANKELFYSVKTIYSMFWEFIISSFFVLTVVLARFLLSIKSK